MMRDEDLPYEAPMNNLQTLQQALGMVQAWKRQAERVDRDLRDLLNDLRRTENSLLDSMVKRFNKP